MHCYWYTVHNLILIAIYSYLISYNATLSGKTLEIILKIRFDQSLPSLLNIPPNFHIWIWIDQERHQLTLSNHFLCILDICVIDIAWSLPPPLIEGARLLLNFYKPPSLIRVKSICRGSQRVFVSWALPIEKCRPILNREQRNPDLCWDPLC